jgi:hypothetical protein
MAHIKDILKRYGRVPMHTYPFSSVFYHKVYLRYLRGVKVFKPLNYMPYIKNDAMAELERIYSWKPYLQKHFESRFTSFFEGYWLPTRFGYDMRRNQFSSLILTGQMTREEALSELEKPPFDLNTIDKEFNYIATKLGISVDELKFYHEMPTKYYWNYRNQKYIFDLGEKILSWISGTRRGGAY